MRKPLLRQTGLVIGLLAILAVLLGNGWIISSNVAVLKDQQKWVEHTHVVILQLETFMARVTDAETNCRAFVFNRDHRFVDTYVTAQKDAWSALEKFRRLTDDNPVQQSAADRLEEFLKIRFHLMDEVIHRAELGERGIPDAIETGRDAMESIRRQVVRSEDSERVLLELRQSESSSAYKQFQITLSITTILNVIFAVVLYVLIRRYLTSQSEESKAQARDAFLRSGEAESATLSGGDRPLTEIAERLVDFICKGIGVPGANFFLVDGGAITLEAGYAAHGEQKFGASDSKLGRSRQFKMGEGLVGGAASRSEITEVKDVPNDYFVLRSSWGEIIPNQLLFLPIRFQNHPVGLLEIAMFRDLDDDQKEWLNVCAKSLGIGINAAIARTKQQLLLEETQRQSEELQTQQEELRTTNEELEEQARELLQSQERLQVQQEELQQTNKELERQTKALEAQRADLNSRNRDLESARAETETKARELEQTSQYKSEFLAKMSHELRTPLNSLMILATLLHENRLGNLNHQQVDFARTIYEAGVDLLNLINDILDLSKLEARKLTARPEVFSIAPFFDQVVAMFKPMVENKGLELRVEIQKEAPGRIETDRQRLQQIIRNLVSNAVKFTESGAIILASAPGSQPDRIRISVRDTGVGIAEEKRQLIFDAFEQADGSVSRKYGGTGLGLTISRELAGLLGGQIEVESTPGEGSTFTIEIPTVLKVDAVTNLPIYSSMQPSQPIPMPLETPQPASSRPQQAVVIQSSVDPKVIERVEKIIAEIPQNSKTILIVEDDEIFRHSVSEAARGFDFFPLEVGDGESALELLRRHTPQAMLLDIRLPGVSGLTVLETIKELPSMRHVPIHMISGMEHQQNSLRMGALGYLGKPVTIDAVRSALSRIEGVISRSVKRLLVVEDDPRQRKAITELVEGKDIEIVSVGTGREALETLKSSLIDCVILDLSLPDCSGFELLERLNEHEEISLPPVIIYTGQDLSKGQEEQLRRYSDSIIIKGAKSPERLLDEVSLFLHRVEAALPEEKRAMLADLRQRDRAFDGRQVLVVDDDLRNVFALTSALETRGFTVLVARNGLEALEAMDQHPKIDVVLMDIMMPKMDGFEAMRRIRQNPNLQKLPIIALTAKTMKGEFERCIEAGASDYLPKPINLSNLLSVLKVWLPPIGLMT